MRCTRRSRITAIPLVSALAFACADGGSDALGDVAVTMQQTDQNLSSAPGFFASVTSGSQDQAVIDAASVQSLVVEISALQFLPAEEENAADDDAAWISLDLASPVELDLMALPTEGESSVVIASGSVEVGSYVAVRLFIQSATVRFNTSIMLGAATFEADTDIGVIVPSADETGLKTDAEFTVSADGEGNVADVHLLFSPSATFLNVTATGDGQVILAPVIRSQPATP